MNGTERAMAIQAMNDRKTIAELKAELDRVKSQRDEMITVCDLLHSSFRHIAGNTKGNKAKTDVILHNDDVKAALNACNQIKIYGYQKSTSRTA